MNEYGVIILAALIGEFLLNIAAGVLNLRSLSDELPVEFQGIYDPDNYKRSQEYLKVNTRFDWIGSSFPSHCFATRQIDVTVIVCGFRFYAILGGPCTMDVLPVKGHRCLRC